MQSITNNHREVPTPTPTTPPFPLHEARRECPACGGDGRVEEYRMATAPGGSRDTPYHDVECGECEGAGWQWTERCDRCGLADPDRAVAWDACECTEDELDAWRALGGGPEVSTAAARVREYLLTHHVDGVKEARHLLTDERWADRVGSAARILRDGAEPEGHAERLLADVLDKLAAGVRS